MKNLYSVVKYSLASVGRSLASRLIVSVSPRQKAQNDVDPPRYT